MHSWSGNCHILSLYIEKSKESELPDVQCTSHNLVYFVAEASFGSKTNISFELLVLTLYNNNNFYDNRKYKHSKVRFLYIVSDHSFIKCLAVYNISACCIIIPRLNSPGPLTDDWKVTDDSSVNFHEGFFLHFLL